MAERIAPLIGAPPGSVAVGDTTTVAVYKAVAAARRLRPDRRYILTDTGNFPTDLYVLHAVADQAGAEVMLVPPDQVLDRISPDVAVVSLTHVDYRTGRRHSIPDVDAAARDAGALVVWDLSHSVGAMDVDMSGSDFAVGCGYKYLNGGPGAPAFIYVHLSHQAGFRTRSPGGGATPSPSPWNPRTPCSGRLPPRPAPNPSWRSWLSTPPSTSSTASTPGPCGSSRATGGRLHRLVDERLPWFEVVTPRLPTSAATYPSPIPRRADHGRLDPEESGRDVRPPNLLRFGLAPAYQRHVEVWDAVEAIRGVMESDAWRHAPERTGPVT